MSERRVVITGLGWVTGLGWDVPIVWADLLAGRSGIQPIQRFDTSRYSVRIAGEVSDWEGGPHLDGKDLRRTDRFVQFALSAAIDAVRDSGLDFQQQDPTRCGVIIGSGVGGIEEFEHGHRRMLEKGPHRVSPFMIPKLMINAASAHVSIHFGLTGVNSATVTACASAGHAIADAHKTISQGEADVMITGGSEAACTPLGLACFMTMKALSTRNDEPEKASRPFDRDRDGFVIAEGAGLLVLEDYDHARKRGAHIYGEVLGYGMSGDGSHITAPKETGEGARDAMSRAVRMAGISLEDVGYVNAHATATHLGDLAENNAIKDLFKDHAYKLAVSSTKSMLGHSLGASGGVEAIILNKVLESGDLPPTVNLDHPDDGCDLNYVAREAQHHDVRYAMSNSFGFGGHNVSLLIGKI
jgi:3-oxoacyl-[acyl-carrier-protein] synthase II